MSSEEFYDASFHRVLRVADMAELRAYLLEHKGESFVVPELASKFDVSKQDVRDSIRSLMSERPQDSRYIFALYSEELDEQGNPTGRIHLRNEVIHRKGILQASSNVIVLNSLGDKMLM